MPVSISLDPRQSITRIVLRDVVSGSELLASVRHLFTTTAVRGGSGVVCDARSLALLNASLEELQNVSDLLDELTAHLRATRWAVVGGGDEVDALATLLMSTCSGAERHVRLFTNLHPAISWAGEAWQPRPEATKPSPSWSRLHRN